MKKSTHKIETTTEFFGDIPTQDAKTPVKLKAAEKEIEPAVSAGQIEEEDNDDFALSLNKLVSCYQHNTFDKDNFYDIMLSDSNIQRAVSSIEKTYNQLEKLHPNWHPKSFQKILEYKYVTPIHVLIELIIHKAI